MTILDQNGHAGVVLPDNVLFEAGRAGEGIRKRLLEQFNFHTLLRLPTGIWYSPGVKANVLFFDKKPVRASHGRKRCGFIALITNVHFTLKTNPLSRSHLDDFVQCYQPEEPALRVESERFRRFAYDELVSHDKNSTLISSGSRMIVWKTLIVSPPLTCLRLRLWKI